MFLTKPNPEIILNKYFFVVEMVDIWVMYKIDKRGGKGPKSFSRTDPIWQCLDVDSS